MQNVSIDHLRDPKRPDYLLRGVWLTPQERAEVGRLGLKDYSGRDLRLVAPSPDPLSAKALRPSAPLELREALSQAEARYHEAETVCEQTYNRFQESTAERATFSQEVGGGPLTDRGNERLRELTLKLEATERDYRGAQDLETECRVERLHAAGALDRWARGESLRRTNEAAEAAAEAKRPKPAPFGERLSKLGKKLAGK